MKNRLENETLTTWNSFFIEIGMRCIYIQNIASLLRIRLGNVDRKVYIRLSGHGVRASPIVGVDASSCMLLLVMPCDQFQFKR